MQTRHPVIEKEGSHLSPTGYIIIVYIAWNLCALLKQFCTLLDQPEQQRIMADRASAVRQMQEAHRSAPFYDGTGLWSTFAFEWRNWCPLAWIGGNGDHITPAEKSRFWSPGSEDKLWRVLKRMERDPLLGTAPPP